MATKEEEFKHRMASVYNDLQSHGIKDPKAMAAIGRLGRRLSEDAGVKSWSELKRGLTAESFRWLLKEMETNGNRLYLEGKDFDAYAVQLLAMSLVARTQKDPDIRGGEALFDRLIDEAIVAHRKSGAPVREEEPKKA